MKTLLLFIMLIFGIGQQPISTQIRIQGLVTDAENRGIASVSVSIPGTKFGTATSSDGRFELVADDSETDSEICFHRMSYATRCIPIRTISGELKVTLANQPIPMPEVVVTPYARINPRRVVNHAATDFKKRRHTDLYVSDAAYVEKASCGGRSCMFTEGVGYLVSFGTHSPIRLDEYSFLSTNMRKSDRGAEWLDLTRNSTRNLGMRHQSDMPPGYNFALNAVASFEVGGPLTRPDRYRYMLVQSAEIPSDEIHIAFRPNRPNGLYQGILILDRFLWQIRSVELRKTSFYSSWMFKEVTASGRIAYQLVDNRVSLHSLEFVIPTNDVVVDIVLRSGIPRDPGNAITPRDYNVLSHNDRNPYVRYDESTWPDTNLYSMAEQFRKNSAQPFLYKEDARGERVGVTGGEATYKTINDRIAALQRLMTN